MPESEKNLLWVKCGLPTKSCTQSRGPRTSSSQIITPSRLMMRSFSPGVTGPRTIRAVCWDTSKNRTIYFRLHQSQISAIFGHDTYFEQKVARENQPAKSKTTGRHPRQGESSLNSTSCRWSRRKDCYSSRQTSISLPLIHPRSKSPSHRRSSWYSGAWSSPPMMIAVQKQLKPWPILERAATVDNTELVNYSRNLRASRWNSFFQIGTPNLIESCQHPRPS